MSRKHFQLIAQAVAVIVDPDQRRIVAELLASVCAASNSRFDRARFIRACNVEGD